jgi:hypothetical protein
MEQEQQELNVQIAKMKHLSTKRVV